MAEKNAMKNTDTRDVIVILLAAVTLCSLCLALLSLFRRGNGGADFTPVPVSEEEKLTDRIALPQFAYLNLAADSTAQTLTFDNPSINYAYFRVSLVMDGETLWESELLAPGKTSKPVKLSRPLSAGEYDVTLCYACFADRREKEPLNGAASPMKLKVE